MKRRSLIKTITAAAIGSPFLGHSKINRIPNKKFIKTKQNPVATSTYSFWQFNGSETPIEYCIEKTAEFKEEVIKLVNSSDK